MKFVSFLLSAAGLASMASAHMELKSPPPFRSSFNPNVPESYIDYSIRSPLNADGSNFPCKGYLGDIGTSRGRAVTTWNAGGTYSFTITGSTPHSGGSCQASVSFDNGRTFKVVHSYIGNCPVLGDSSWPFTLPNDTPAGQMIFAWTWFNNIGNREMYMNCAVVNVVARRKARRGAADPLNSRPAMFVANVGNGICTWEGTDVEFPNPGPDVSRNSKKTHAPGTGVCNIFGGP